MFVVAVVVIIVVKFVIVVYYYFVMVIKVVDGEIFVWFLVVFLVFVKYL